MDAKRKAGLQKIIDNNNATAPTVTVEIETKFPGETKVDKTVDTAQGVIVLMNRGMRFDEDDNAGFDATIQIKGAFCRATIEGLLANLIDNIELKHPGVRRALLSRLRANDIM